MLSDFLGIKPRLIINNDIDGLVCGALLIKYYDAIIIGFSNSKDKIWLINNNKLDGKEIYIDMYKRGCKCIEQHIHPRFLENVLNPNFDRDVYYFEGFKNKYPFSTALYLCALIGQEKPIFMFETLRQYEDKLNMLLRADDTLNNCKKYTENTLSWQKFMIEYYTNDKQTSQFLNDFFEYVNEHKKEDLREWNEVFLNRLKIKCGFTGKDELIDFNLDSPERSAFLKNFLKLDINAIETIKMISVRTNIRTIEEYDRLMESDIFSYAFIYGLKNKNKNFSYTIKKPVN